MTSAIMAFLRTATSQRERVERLAGDLHLSLPSDLGDARGLLRKQDVQDGPAPLPDLPCSAFDLSPPTQRARQKILQILLSTLPQPLGGSSGMVDMVVQAGGLSGTSDFAGALSVLLDCGRQEGQVVAAGTAFLTAHRDTPSQSISDATKTGSLSSLIDVARCVAVAHDRLATAAAEECRTEDLASAVASLSESVSHASLGTELLKEWEGKAGSEGATVLTASHSLLRKKLLDTLLVGHIS